MSVVLEAALNELFLKHGVHEKVTAYMRLRNMVTVSQFAGIADDLGDVIEGIRIPAGLNVEDIVVCQAVKVAWQESEDGVQAKLDAIKKGVFMEFDAVHAPLVVPPCRKKLRVTEGEPCVYFGLGKCNYGNRCRFVHAATHQGSGSSAAGSDSGQGDAVGLTSSPVVTHTSAESSGAEAASGAAASKVLDKVEPQRLSFSEYRKLCLFLYTHFNPRNVNRIDEIMGKYRGHESDLVNAFVEKYGVSQTAK